MGKKALAFAAGFGTGYMGQQERSRENARQDARDAQSKALHDANMENIKEQQDERRREKADKQSLRDAASQVDMTPGIITDTGGDPTKGGVGTTLMSESASATAGMRPEDFGIEQEMRLEPRGTKEAPAPQTQIDPKTYVAPVAATTPGIGVGNMAPGQAKIYTNQVDALKSKGVYNDPAATEKRILDAQRIIDPAGHGARVRAATEFANRSADRLEDKGDRQLARAKLARAATIEAYNDSIQKDAREGLRGFDIIAKRQTETGINGAEGWTSTWALSKDKKEVQFTWTGPKGETKPGRAFPNTEIGEADALGGLANVPLTTMIEWSKDRADRARKLVVEDRDYQLRKNQDVRLALEAKGKLSAGQEFQMKRADNEVAVARAMAGKANDLARSFATGPQAGTEDAKDAIRASDAADRALVAAMQRANSMGERILGKQFIPELPTEKVARTMTEVDVTDRMKATGGSRETVLKEFSDRNYTLQTATAPTPSTGDAEATAAKKKADEIAASQRPKPGKILPFTQVIHPGLSEADIRATAAAGGKQAQHWVAQKDAEIAQQEENRRQIQGSNFGAYPSS